jgi:hypothetical protein
MLSSIALWIYDHVLFQDEFLTPLLICCVVGSSTFDAAKLLVQSNASVDGVAQVLNSSM